MNDYIPGEHPSLYSTPLGTRKPPGWGSRHSLLALMFCIVLWHALGLIWRLSQAYVLRTKGSQALRRYNRSFAWKFPLPIVLLAVILGSAPFADPVTMTAGEYVFGFACTGFTLVFPAVTFPVLCKAWRELAWRRAAR